MKRMTKLILTAVLASGILATTTLAQESAPAVAPATSPSDLTIVDPPASVLRLDPAVQESVLLSDDILKAPSAEPLPATTFVAPLPTTVPACGACGHQQCCCPVKTTICLEEPNCGCTHEIKVTLPGCCMGEAPVVSWRRGILGRQIATLCWTCCDKRVKVVIPRFGGPRVRE